MAFFFGRAFFRADFFTAFAGAFFAAALRAAGRGCGAAATPGRSVMTNSSSLSSSMISSGSPPSVSPCLRFPWLLRPRRAYKLNLIRLSSASAPGPVDSLPLRDILAMARRRETIRVRTLLLHGTPRPCRGGGTTFTLNASSERGAHPVLIIRRIKIKAGRPDLVRGQNRQRVAHLQRPAEQIAVSGLDGLHGRLVRACDRPQCFPRLDVMDDRARACLQYRGPARIGARGRRRNRGGSFSRLRLG